MNVQNEAALLYNAKIRSGKYNHYTPEMLEILFADCIMQAKAMQEYCGVRK